MSEAIQGSPEWLAARCGRVTASRMGDLVAKTKTGWGASRGNYKAELVAERLSGQPYPQFTSAPMRWGTETEPQARAAYEFLTNSEVKLVGFVAHPQLEMCGASPDGLVGDEGLIETKCPNTATHITSLLGGAIESGYIHQMQWQMACTGRRWCDFVSFDPRLPPVMQLKVTRVPRDDVAIAVLASEVRLFLAEVNDQVRQLNHMFGMETP